MFDKLRKYLKLSNLIIKNKSQKSPKSSDNMQAISTNLEQNLTMIKQYFHQSEDVVLRQFRIGNKKKSKAFVCWIDGLVDQIYVNSSIIKALTIDIYIAEEGNEAQFDNADDKNLLTIVKEQIINSSSMNEVTSIDEALGAILSGQTALFIDGYRSVLLMGSEGWPTRAITEPSTESVVRGPREGFTETLRVNTSLMRRKIKNPNLVFKSIVLGKQTQTKICVSYIKGIASEALVEEVLQRLKRIDTDAILESGYIEQFIEDHPLSLFSTISNSEKPDVVAAKILEGRVAILCDGTPFVLTVPRLFVENFQVSEDYYTRSFAASFLRTIRYFSFISSIITPALYVAIETFHQEMIPTVLLISMAASREGIPFPAVLEALIMLSVFEILRESGVRLPRVVGQAVSFVGAIVIGQSAVQAGFISAPIVIIVSLAGITSFILPSLYDFILISRFIFILLGGLLGLYGISAGLIVLLAHLCSLRSFGAPFLAPIAPMMWKEWKDTFIRAPLRLMKSRPASISTPNPTRQNMPILPVKPKSDNER